MKPFRVALCLGIAGLSLVWGGVAQTESGGRLKARMAARMQAKAVEESRTVNIDAIVPGTRKLTQSYGTNAKQSLDVYIPPNAHNAPVIVMVHGGAWKIGDKANTGSIENKLKYWLPKGYVFVSVNYRLLPEAMAYEQAQDVVEALGATQSYAKDWAANADKIILMGHSAGAHIVALLSSNPAMVKQRWAGTVVLDSAVMKVSTIMEGRHLGFYDEAFGADKTYWAKASPMDQWTPAAVPMMVVCSTRRKDKPCDQARAFQARVTAAGLSMPVLPQDLTHEEINRNLGLDSAYTHAVDTFITQRLKTTP